MSNLEIRAGLADIAGGYALVVVFAVGGQSGPGTAVHGDLGTRGELRPDGSLVVYLQETVPTAIYSAGTYTARILRPETVPMAGLNPLPDSIRARARDELERMG